MAIDNNRLAYSPGEAAHALGLSINNVYTLVREGKLPSLRLGKRLLIPRVELERLLRQDHYDSQE